MLIIIQSFTFIRSIYIFYTIVIFLNLEFDTYNIVLNFKNMKDKFLFNFAVRITRLKYICIKKVHVYNTYQRI